MGELFALLQSEPLSGEQAIPYLGETAIYESILNVVASDQIADADAIAINVAQSWFKKEPGESQAECLTRLRQKAWRTGQELGKIRLRERDKVGSPSIPAGAEPVREPAGPSTIPPPATPGTSGGSSPGSIPTGGIATPGSATGGGPPIPGLGGGVISGGGLLPTRPVIRRSMGAKTGINLLGDLETWALPDKQTIAEASLTLKGLSIKEIRELVTKMPPKLQAELQITLPPSDQPSSDSSGGSK